MPARDSRARVSNSLEAIVSYGPTSLKFDAVDATDIYLQTDPKSGISRTYPGSRFGWRGARHEKSGEQT
jgi:hypothetical protein